MTARSGLIALAGLALLGLAAAEFLGDTEGAQAPQDSGPARTDTSTAGLSRDTDRVRTPEKEEIVPFEGGRSEERQESSAPGAGAETPASAPTEVRDDGDRPELQFMSDREAAAYAARYRDAPLRELNSALAQCFKRVPSEQVSLAHDEVFERGEAEKLRDGSSNGSFAVGAR